VHELRLTQKQVNTNEFKAVGRSNVPGRLSYTIATGGAKFGTDVVVPDMLYAKYLRCPHGRAKINPTLTTGLTIQKKSKREKPQVI
jgi:hypothetical protein